MGKRGEGWVLLQLVLLVLIATAPLVVKSDPFPPWLRIVGALILLAGIVLAALGLRALGPSLSPFPKPVDNGQLVTTGIYGIVRHLIYAGLIIGALGWALLTGTLPGLALAILLFLFFDAKSRREERWLVQKYAGYRAYRERVHKLIPWLY
jgi:protein-S-isoprenylcysteine O-methyltransferase Ste14